MSSYAIKAVNNTLVSEGARAGSRVVSVHFAGCNLWDGHPLHRDDGPSPCSQWCDADFQRGTIVEHDDLIAVMNGAWAASTEIGDNRPRWCLFTGGEPLLQVDRYLINDLRLDGWRIAVETNGCTPTTWAGGGAYHVFDHVVVSPKRGAKLVIATAHELRVVLPGASPDRPTDGWTDDELVALARAGKYDRLFVTPQDPLLDPNSVQLTHLRLGAGDAVDDETRMIGGTLYNHYLERCIGFVLAHPDWSLSAQMGKLVGLP